MTKTIFFVVLTALTSTTYAARFAANIHSIAMGKNGQEHILKLTDGRVVFVDPADHFSPRDFLPGSRVEIETGDELKLDSITSLPEEPIAMTEDMKMGPQIKQEPTVLDSEAAAQNIFGGMNRSWKAKTECTDRAHVWAWEENKKNNLVSQKVFMFFTNTYIRKYRWHWWFHVSPYTLVKAEEVKERVLDRKYLNGPVSMKTWTDYFIRSRKECPVTTYRHYRANRNGAEHCFLVKAPMFYRLPYHVRMLEDYGQAKNSFSPAEVNFSYRAFIRRGVRR